MPQAGSLNWLELLKQPRDMSGFQPIAIRFLLSLRLIAVHRQSQRDPVPELTAKLGSVSVAIASLEMVETMARLWPEPIQVGRLCCQVLTHDEAMLAAAIEAADKRDRDAFEAELSGFLRPSRIDVLWEQTVSLIAAEYAAATH